MRTCFFAFAALVIASLAMLSRSSPPAFAIAVGPPSVRIMSPADGAVIPLNTVISFDGDGADSDGTPLVRGQLQWGSSRNGFLDTGPSFTRNSSTLALGLHTIRLLATGNNYGQSSVSISIWIGPPPTATPTNTPTATNTPTNTPTSTPTPTDTPVPPTPTNTPVPPTSTNTPLPPTSTNTPLPPTSTNTPLPPTSTSTPPPAAATGTPRPNGTRVAPTATATPRPSGWRCADFDGDGKVTWRDVWIIASAVERRSHDLKFDVNGNGRVGWGDVWATLRQVGRRCGDGPRHTPTPSRPPEPTPTPRGTQPHAADPDAVPPPD